MRQSGTCCTSLARALEIISWSPASTLFQSSGMIS